MSTRLKTFFYYRLVDQNENDLAIVDTIRKNFRTAPYLIMHIHLTGDTLNNKAPYMDV